MRTAATVLGFRLSVLRLTLVIALLLALSTMSVASPCTVAAAASVVNHTCTIGNASFSFLRFQSFFITGYTSGKLVQHGTPYIGFIPDSTTYNTPGFLLKGPVMISSVLAAGIDFDEAYAAITFDFTSPTPVTNWGFIIDAAGTVPHGGSYVNAGPGNEADIWAGMADGLRGVDSCGHNVSIGNESAAAHFGTTSASWLPGDPSISKYVSADGCATPGLVSGVGTLYVKLIVQSNTNGVVVAYLDPAAFYMNLPDSALTNPQAFPDPTPEPSSLILITSGLVGLSAMVRRKLRT